VPLLYIGIQGLSDCGGVLIMAEGRSRAVQKGRRDLATEVWVWSKGDCGGKKPGDPQEKKMAAFDGQDLFI